MTHPHEERVTNIATAIDAARAALPDGSLGGRLQDVALSQALATLAAAEANLGILEMLSALVENIESGRLDPPVT